MATGEFSIYKNEFRAVGRVRKLTMRARTPNAPGGSLGLFDINYWDCFNVNNIKLKVLIGIFETKFTRSLHKYNIK